MKQAGIDPKIGTSVVNFMGMSTVFVTAYLLTRVGRRTLLIIFPLLMTLDLLALTYLLWDGPQKEATESILTLILIVCFSVFF